MYLKRLELLGFKSFPDKTIIKFTPGVTSIVGPNGCGKTNVLDSIRWVLGEQRVSLLRGTKMEEIIFNGTRDIKPLGMAEVTLVIQNNRGILPTEYSEVQITRRLFRSGESEYLLNKVPCRLKDITDLLMDTGIGSHIYSVIQQEMVDAILSDRADERRFLFEEAAGISKYKNRKKAALRKLDATEGDLLRLKDIIAEVTTQVNSLKRQMNRTRRFKNLSEELKAWELFLSKTSIDDLSRERKQLLSQRDTLSDSRMKFDTDIDTLSARQEEERKKLTDLDNRLSEVSNRIYEKSEEAHSLEKEITVLRERRDNTKQLKEKNILDIEAFKKRRAILLEQIKQTENELVRTSEELTQLQDATETAEKELASADDEVLSARRGREDLGKRLVALEGRISAGKSDDTNLKEQESEIDESLSNFDQRSGELRTEKNELLQKRSILEKELFVMKGRINESQSRQSSIESEIAALNEELDDVSGRVYDLSASLEAGRARQHLLKEMVAQYEGYSSGTVAAMEIQERWPRLIGTVADNITPNDGFEEAVESALGEMAGFMVCEDRTTAEGIIGFLRRENKGKAGLLIINEAAAVSETTRPDVSGNGFLGWADNFVTVTENLKPLTALLLSRVAVVKPEDSLAIIDQLPPFFSAVTTDGRFFQGKAIVSGGSNESFSLLGRKEKIAAQEKAISELSGELDTVKELKNSKTAALGSNQADLNSVISEQNILKDEVEAKEKEFSELKFELQSTENELNRIEKEHNELSIKLEALRNKQYDLNLNYDQIIREKDELVGRLNDHDQQIKNLEEVSSKAETEFSNLQIRQVELKSKRQQLESQTKHTGELISEIDSSCAAKSEEISQADSEIQEATERIVQLEWRLKETFDVRAEIAGEQTRIRENHSSLQENLDAREKEIKSLRQRREEISTQLHNTEIKMAEIDSDMKSVKQKIRDEYDVDPEEVSAEPPDSGIPPDARTQRMQELKERLKDFGDVNLMALEEYEVARERQEFLTAQIDDLLNAKSTLQSTISKINQTARKLFLETFDQVRTNFKQVFEELFTGGDADIRLINEDDPLESPIEITARPRGKRLLSIAQMSGGERALTAISLLFAIYLAKPSPFCILDEIDAPLDDANIHRFLKIIKTFSDETQFIIITHNKITMEAANILYGITMEQPGISRVVSVRFNEEEDEPIIDTAIGDDTALNTDGIPSAVRERITPKVNISQVDNSDKDQG